MSSVNAIQKKDHRQHILDLPDTYIGSTEAVCENQWIFDDAIGKMVYRAVAFNPGFYKIFDELIVNARDAVVRSNTTEGATPIKHIGVEVVETDCGQMIIVENDGDGIPVEIHPEYKVMAPELIFGHLLTSTNYDKGEEKIVGGKNGYGAKLTNIYSKIFTVEVKNPGCSKHYEQTWSDNMTACSKPTVKKMTGSKGMVRVEFVPDYDRFSGVLGEDGLLSADMLGVLYTRVIELAAVVGNGVKVSWNKAVLPTNTFEKYVKLFCRDGASVFHEVAGPRWDIAVALTSHLADECDCNHVSFANGIRTRKGGKHVEAVQKNVIGDFCEAAKKKKVEIKPAQLRDNVIFFINATIVNPSFDSQTKDFLTTPASKFGSSPKFSGSLVTGLMKSGLLEEAKQILEAKLDKEAKKTDGKKRSTLRGMPKLEDATLAGTAKSVECTLILTEGDSAATSAISGLQIVGRERWGVFPLKGKLLNVKDISLAKVNANEELTAIKKILGLEHGKKYKDVKSLRYGRVMVMADQDHDGSHIKGLLMNFFHTEWPELLQLGFVCSLLTPILKATRGKTQHSFYSIPEFEAWREANGGHTRGWSIKYYKGLGTSTQQEAKEWFKDLHEVSYVWDEEANDNISLAFTKSRADDRKTWLATYDPKRCISLGEDGAVSYTSFINDELIHFSNADNIRSLPHLMDGMKPSQRKVLFSCLKRNLTTEIKVAQLAGYVSEHAAYHHGEKSLADTIKGMAQNFVGSNNINLLKPIGQFGSRIQGGKDAASERYIFTALEPIVGTMIHKADAPLLKAQDDDGMAIEPEYYMPVVPLLAINGSLGIGTGFSTYVPAHKPEDVIALLRCRLNGQVESLAGHALDPWWAGFKGRMTRVDTHKWLTHGCYEIDEEAMTITISELPVGVWSKDYKEDLDKMCATDEAIAASGLRNYDSLYNDVDVKFVLYVTDEVIDMAQRNPTAFEKLYGLTSSWSTTNMNCFDENMNIVRYETVGDMIEAFFNVRLAAYDDRKRVQLEELEKERVEIDAKRKFLLAVIEDRIKLVRQTDAFIVEQLKGLELPPLSDPEKPDQIEAYDYLMRLRIDRVKAAAIAELERLYAEHTATMEELRGKTAGELWEEDLDAFEEAWNKMVVAREAETADMKADGAAAAAKGKKKAAAKTRR